ncbi:MAG: DEAD/DEAH box helicase family protein [Gammaproteobacteria bacterium]|nr:DEAD/DEAH box helicase family protein [Gammaproteobacteria bacterium]
MSDPFFEQPILNSPYEYPARHWELDGAGQPTGKIADRRRRADFVTPIPKPKKTKGAGARTAELLDQELSDSKQQYAHVATLIANVRKQVDNWRRLPNRSQWQVTPATAQLLHHWRNHRFSGIRPFFCQVEAAETIIWLTEVAPNARAKAKEINQQLAAVNREANPELSRIALKLATGAGKTTVMAMLIAWQTINAVRHPQSERFTKGFLIVTPGITIRDRLRVLLPNDPESYYRSRELVPQDMLRELEQAKIVITNYHAFQRRERTKLSSGGRALLKGKGGADPITLESEGQMLQRVMPELMGMKNILAINDEAHHCYREKPGEAEEEKRTGEARKEAENNQKAARLWISGLEAAKRGLKLSRVVDLSATPFFLSGSGYREGTLFPWTVSDFSLMDAIECGIVKLPRVPIADNVPEAEMPVFRNLWEHIGKKMPKKGRGAGAELDPHKLPPQLVSALDALYGHYEKTFDLWKEKDIEAPPCFIIVCNNTATSKLVYDYVAGFKRELEDGTQRFHNGRLSLFRNFDEEGNSIPRPRTLLIDSNQLESGEALDQQFRKFAADEIERFRREIVTRTGDKSRAEKLTDEDLLREVMNTVGKPGKLGGSIRCVVSVAMLSEGWDANTVTHVLGIRAFGTQLLCEQVVGRALRRLSYELNDNGLFDAEYADVLGIPFNFTAKPVEAKPNPPRETIQVNAVRPERDALEIRFPRVAGYRTELPKERLAAKFNADSLYRLTPEIVGPTEVTVSGIIGKNIKLSAKDLKKIRKQEIAYRLAAHLLESRWRDENGQPKLHLFGPLRRIAGQWLDGYLECAGGTYPGQLLHKMLADQACERIHAAILQSPHVGEKPITVVLDAYNPIGSTHNVNFTTSKTSRFKTDPNRCPVNWAILDSNWEGEFCRIAEAHPRVLAYVKNHNMGFEVPYRHRFETRRYVPDFIVLVDDGNGSEDPLHLVVEIKGYRGEDAKDKKNTMDAFWVPGVNHHGGFGRWAFAEFTDVNEMEADFESAIATQFANLLGGLAA